MRLNLLLISCSLFLLTPLAFAQENIIIEEIGTVPKDLIEGMGVQLFANLSYRGNEPAEIDLEFWLDSTRVDIQKGIKLEPNKTFQKISDTFSKVSLSNNKIETRVYFANSTREIGRKNAQIIVNKKISPEQEKNNFNYLSLEFVGPIILIFVGIIVLLYILVSRKRKTVEKKKIKAEVSEISLQESPKQLTPQTQPQEIASELSNEIRFFSSKLLEEHGQEAEYKLLSDYLGNIAFIIENINKNNREGAKLGLKNVKEMTINISSKFKDVPKSTILPGEIEVTKLKKLQEEELTFSTRKLITKLDKQRAEMNRKNQFIDVMIPGFLLKMAEERIEENDIKAAEGLIFSAKELLENEEVLQRLRKLREIGF